MAVTRKGNSAVLSAANDTLTGRQRVNGILITQVSGAGGNVRIYEGGGVSGNLLVDGTTSTADTFSVTFSYPQDIKDLTVTALPANAAVAVLLA